MIKLLIAILGVIFTLTVLACITVGAESERIMYVPKPNYPKPPIPGEENKEEE